jgi:hypothetical protein
MKKKLYNQFACSRMMLPEHREDLKNLLEPQQKHCLPSLDEQQYQVFERILSQSMQYGLEVRVTVWAAKGQRTVSGPVQKTGTIPGQLRIATKDGVKTVEITKIIAVEKLSNP